MRTPIIAGNWKMYKTVKESVEFAKALDAKVKGLSGREAVICPTMLAVASVADALKGSAIQVGCQDAHWEDEGAFTGNVSPKMLREVGVKYCILGHSERRQYEKETNETINKKAKNVLKNGLRAIICVGETLQDREAGKTNSVIETQFKGCFEGIPESDLANVVIAYEPVWAIGTGKTASPAQAQEVHAFIRSLLKAKYGDAAANAMRIQYGGSVKPENVKELMGCPDIDGALVGGAALKVDSFVALINF
jgi:triosephosphate isomerase